MYSRLIRIVFILMSFVFLTGFIPIFSLLGPGMTVLSSGNIYKAGAQFFINQRIEQKTGKDTLTYVKDEIKSKDNNHKFNQELKELVEKRIKLARKKLNLNNLNQ